MGAFAALPAPAAARDGQNAALFGGLAAGALVGGAIASGPRYYEPAPVYPAYDPDPAYRPYPAYRARPVVETYEEPVVVRRCLVRREPLFNRRGEVASYRNVRVCR